MFKSNFILITILMFAGTSTFASNVARAEKGEGPCRKIVDACTAAGFVKGGHKPKKGENKGLWKDCVNQIVSGQSVPGVTVDPSEIEACKVKRASKGK